MAEAFVKKIEDFLACSICFEQLKDPVGLPCLHGFCFECLHDWHKASQDKTHVVCPACKRNTPLPEDGIRGFPGHFLVNNLKETVHMEKQKVDTSTCSEIQVLDQVILEGTEKEGIVQSIDGKEVEVDFSGEMWTGKASSLQLVSRCTTSSAPCDLCSKPADSHCLDCKQYLCKQCHKQHDAFKLMKDHTIVAIKDDLSGKNSSQGRHCPVHGKMILYYCNYEDKQVCQDCITLKTCATWHQRISISRAAKKQLEILKQLTSALEGKKEVYSSYLSKTEKVRESLDTSYQKANKDLGRVITETTEKLQELLQKKRELLTEEYSMKDKQLSGPEGELKSKVSSSEKAYRLAKGVIKYGSDHDILFKFSTLKTTMEGIASSTDEYDDINESLGSISFEPGKLEDYIKLTSDSPACKESKQKDASKNRQASHTWIPCKHFKTDCFTNLIDIAIFPDGDLAIASQNDGAEIYSAMGNYEHTLQNAPKKLHAIAVTPDGRIITTGRSKLLCYNRYGKLVGTITTKAPPVAVAVDKNGTIIAGFDDSIFFEFQDGLQVWEPLDSVRPYYISTTSQSTLVITLIKDYDNHNAILVVMAYDGRTITTINPPHHKVEWDPGYTCCNSRDEIFVINETGDNCIYWYTYEGQYLGLVTLGVGCPRGLTVSTDDELVVAESDGMVMYFS